MSAIDNICLTQDLYKGGFLNYLFSKIRFWDSPYMKVEKMIPKDSHIIDMGCGEGIFTNYMAVASKGRDILGIELNEGRICSADKKLANVKYQRGSVLKLDLPQCDCIVMFHLLHHLKSFTAQEELLRSSYKLLRKNGVLLIVEIDTKPLIKYLITWITDHFLVPWLFEKKFYQPEIYFRSSEEWEVCLGKLGYSKIRVSNLSGGKPFSHVVLKCLKK